MRFSNAIYKIKNRRRGPRVGRKIVCLFGDTGHCGTSSACVWDVNIEMVINDLNIQVWSSEGNFWARDQDCKHMNLELSLQHMKHVPDLIWPLCCTQQLFSF